MKSALKPMNYNVSFVADLPAVLNVNFRKTVIFPMCPNYVSARDAARKKTPLIPTRNQ